MTTYDLLGRSVEKYEILLGEYHNLLDLVRQIKRDEVPLDRLVVLQDGWRILDPPPEGAEDGVQSDTGKPEVRVDPGAGE